MNSAHIKGLQQVFKILETSKTPAYEATEIYDHDTTFKDDDHDCKIFNDPEGHCYHFSHQE